MNNSNYPDDIHNYDDDPRSPEYIEPLSEEELEAKNAAEEDYGDYLYDQKIDKELDILMREKL